MATDIPIRCACGKFEAVAENVSPSGINFGYCYCDDCQLFEHHLGKADEVLDANGGTAIFQMSPVKFRFVAGQEHLASLQLRRGGLVRWYTSCCNTPVANTMGKPTLPFVGVITACVDSAMSRDELDAAVGPVRFRVHGRYAKGDVPGAHPKAPLSLVGRFLRLMVGWRLAGGAKQSPFFDPATARPSVKPIVLTAEELNRAVDQQARWPSPKD